MSKNAKDPAVYLVDMLLEMNNIRRFCVDKKRDDLMTIYALMRAFTVLGEAAKRIPEAIRSEFSVIPWVKIIRCTKYFKPSIMKKFISRGFGLLWSRNFPCYKENLNYYIHH